MSDHPSVEDEARRLLAFTGEYDGNIDIYVVPAAGGVPRRLTWHPGGDAVAGWTPDGRVTISTRFGNTNQLHVVPLCPFAARLFETLPEVRDVLKQD